jgi:hypothetical protein
VAGCGGEHADLTQPAMYMPRDTVVYLAVDLNASSEDSERVGELARRLGAEKPIDLLGDAGRALASSASGRAAVFAVPERDGRGVALGVVVEAADAEQARTGYDAVRELVDRGRAQPPPPSRGVDPLAALDRARRTPGAAAIVDERWIVFGDPRAVRAATIAANGLSLGESVPFRRTVESHRGDGPGLFFADPRPLGEALAGLLGLSERRAAILADRFLGVRFAKPLGGALSIREGGVVRLDTQPEDGCPAVPLADAGGAPSDADVVAGLPIYGLAQRPCVPEKVNDQFIPMVPGPWLNLDRTLSWLVPSRLAIQDGSVAVSTRIADDDKARRWLPHLGKRIDSQPRVRARATPERLDVRAKGFPFARFVLREGRGLAFVGPIAPPSEGQTRDTPAYQRAQELLGSRELTALWRDPLPGIALIAAGAPREGAVNRGSGARVVIAPR